MTDSKNKYLKYKKKYLDLKNLSGGMDGLGFPKKAPTKTKEVLEAELSFVRRDKISEEEKLQLEEEKKQNLDDVKQLLKVQLESRLKKDPFLSEIQDIFSNPEDLSLLQQYYNLTEDLENNQISIRILDVGSIQEKRNKIIKIYPNFPVDSIREDSYLQLKENLIDASIEINFEIQKTLDEILEALIGKELNFENEILNHELFSKIKILITINEQKNTVISNLLRKQEDLIKQENLINEQLALLR